MVNVASLRFNVIFKKAFSQLDVFRQFVHLVFLNPRIRNEQTPQSVIAWLELIDDSLDEQVDETQYSPPVFQQVIEEIRRDNITPQELARIKDEAVVERAFRESFEGGLERGRKTREIEIARSMLARGVDVTLIAEVTGLSPEEIASPSD